MLMSDSIAQLIEKMLDNNSDFLEIQRNVLANTVGCVPSQINYVITSRFTPERGYIVESRRGGGGYIRIRRVKLDRERYLMHMLAAVGDNIDHASVKVFLQNLCDNELLEKREAVMLSNCLSDNALSMIEAKEDRDKLRASMLKIALLSLATI